jgi:hopanoid biosynthesis associated protein HpnK
VTSRTQRTRKVIITGDDFGLAVPVNEAIEQAFRHGALTTTSLLVGEHAAADAIVRARRNPGLRVGLHLAVCEARPVLPAHEIPALVNARGQLRHPLAALVQLLMPWSWPSLEAEIRAQFAAFAATGLPLDHVNGHNHMQLHPAVLPILLRVAREYGSPPIRIAYEPLLASTRAAGLRRLLARAPWLVMRPWNAYIKRRLVRAGFRSNDYLFGIYDCGQVDLALLLGFIRNLPEGVSEIHCHPARARCPEIDRTMPGYQHEAELAALLSPQVLAALEANDVSSLSGFRDC